MVKLIYYINLQTQNESHILLWIFNNKIKKVGKLSIKNIFFLPWAELLCFRLSFFFIKMLIFVLFLKRFVGGAFFNLSFVLLGFTDDLS